MIISINWLKKFIDISLPIDDLATLIGARLVEIESVEDLGTKYKDVIVAKVVESQPLEGSDHLNLTKLDDNSKVLGVERDANRLVQVVCGAPNVRYGQLVAWLPPGTIVPETIGDVEPFVLSSKNLRGVMSNGMIASAKELDLFDEHTGILELDQDVAPGSSFAEAYELNDYLLDIENKSLTHRPDTFGVIGFAREVAAITGKSFKTPDWLANTNPEFSEKHGDIQTLSVTIDEPKLSARYQAVVLSGANGSAQSSVQVQTYLARSGVRPISAVVDVTNYLMLLTGQPLHAFDYDKLCALNNGKADIHVRVGRGDGDTLKLLDGRVVTLTLDDIVIANGDIPVALAGAMGGQATEIDSSTKNIIVESATFNLYNLRGTQMRHGIFSEAITRFTKGQPAALTAPVLAEAVRLMGEWSGAERVSDVAEAYSDQSSPVLVELSIDKINTTLGTTLEAQDVISLLQSAEFIVETHGDLISVTSPYWRTDVNLNEDVIEEVGRLYGFGNINATLPTGDFRAVEPSNFEQLKSTIRNLLVRAGANEVLTYSFVHGDVLQKASQKVEDSYRITNSISPDLQYYRQTLTPSLLGLVHPNSKQGYDDFAVFEINKVHPKPHGLTDEGVPKEIDMVALTVNRKKMDVGSPYYLAKKLLDYLGQSLGLELVYTAIETEPDYPVTAAFEYRRSAYVTDRKTSTFIGIIGEYKKSVMRGFKLPDYSAGFEVDARALLAATQKIGNIYSPLSRYPSSARDICFKVESSVSYQRILDEVSNVLVASGLENTITPVDIYQPSDTTTKNITIRIKLTPHNRTLTGDEVNILVNQVTESVMDSTGASVI